MKQSERCAVNKCTKNVSSNISLFRFPKDPTRCHLWMEGIGREDLLDKSPEYIWKHCRICGCHFGDDSFTTNKRNRLMPEAIPTIFAHGKEATPTGGFTIYIDDDKSNDLPPNRRSETELLSSVCRGCMTSNRSDLSYLLEESTLKVFQRCTRIEVRSNDCLPNAICSQCLNACRFWADFQAQCLQTEMLLKAQMSENKNDGTLDISGQTIEDCFICSTCDEKIFGHQYLNHLCNANADTFDDNEEESVECAPDFSEYDDESSRSTLNPEELEDLVPLASNSHVDNIDYEPAEDDDKKFKPYKCTKCDWRFKCLKRFTEHKLFHEYVDEVKCRICDIVFKQVVDLSKHCRKVHPNELTKNYVCKECGMAFAHYERLKVHASRHYGKKDKMCNQCGELFILTSDLRMHVIRKHTDRPKVHKCGECHKIFNSVSSLRAHQRIVHVKERAFVCEICLKAFKRNAQLRAHILTHVEPKVCEKCQRNFKSDSAFKMHATKCKGLPASGKTVKRRQTLKRPTVICPLCNEVCPHIRSLSGHLQERHSGEEGIDIQQIIESVKQEQCKHCGKRYFDRFALNLHMNKVHRQKRIECEHCRRMFRDHGTLKTHIAAAHKSKADIPGQFEMFLTQKEILSGHDPFLKNGEPCD